jgi:3-oxosteroid 1-dehydrogenase
MPDHGIMPQTHTDVLVVGSGAGGLVSAITARAAGLSVLLIESTELVGGCTSMSGGGLWIPANSLMAEAGVADSYEAALTYMNGIITDCGLASSHERRSAYLTSGPQMVEFLKRQGMGFSYDRGYADYYPHNPGGLVDGRCIGGQVFDLNRLGAPWKDKVRGWIPLVMTTQDARTVHRSFSREGRAVLFNAIVCRMVGGSLKGRKNAGLGVALIGRLLEIALNAGVAVWMKSPLCSLVEDGGCVIGAFVEKEGARQYVAASRGVILAAGGFAHNLRMRQEYGPAPITTDWTSASPGDTGGGILAGMEIGADVALMDDAWWGPSMITEAGAAQFMLWERSDPHCLIVDAEGRRYMNESASYVDCGHLMYEHNAGGRAIPSYLILDAQHRNSYMLGMLPPRMSPKKAFTSGFLTKAATLEGLAAALGIDSRVLCTTVERFNSFCATGKDLDFQRGDSAYDRLYSDPAVRPNPNLGMVAKSPFYAVKVWPGDLSTKGGLLTDEHARVLRPDATIIGGLYATGNNSASVMGRTYPGPGATIGPSAVFGYCAAQHAAGALAN